MLVIHLMVADWPTIDGRLGPDSIIPSSLVQAYLYEHVAKCITKPPGFNLPGGKEGKPPPPPLQFFKPWPPRYITHQQPQLLSNMIRVH